MPLLVQRAAGTAPAPREVSNPPHLDGTWAPAAPSATAAGTATDGGTLLRMRPGNQTPPVFRDGRHRNMPHAPWSVSSQAVQCAITPGLTGAACAGNADGRSHRPNSPARWDGAAESPVPRGSLEATSSEMGCDRDTVLLQS